VVSLVSTAEVSVGVAGTVASSMKLPTPVLRLPAASVLVSATAFRPSLPKANWPSTGAIAPVSTVQVLLTLAVTW
jgi:hypothetical protein